MRKVLQNLYEKAWPSRWGPPLTLMTALLSFVWLQTNAQTDRIPAADGDFSNGATFTANGWSVSNGTNHQWIVGNGHGLGAPFAGDAAYVTNAAPAYAYTPASNSNNFFWRDVTVPVGETIMQLSFNWNSQGEAGWDNWQVFVGPTSITPVGNNTHPGFGTNNVPAPIAGATYIGNGAPTAGIQSFTASIPASFAGTTFRVFFSWKNETGGTQPPAAIDNIRLTSAVPANRLATATGGLWSSPTTWADGVVPAAGNDITIPAGSTVYIDQALNYRNYTVNGTLGWGSGTFALTATGDITVAAGGTFYGFNSGGTGQTINCLGSFTSNGFANLSVSALIFGGTGAATLGGGSFTNYYNNGSQALVATLQMQNTGSLNVALPINVRTLNPLGGTITGGSNITLDNTLAQAIGSGYRGLFYAGITTVANMGTGYTTAPVIASSGAATWAAGAIGIGAVRVNAGHQYVSLDATASVDAPVHTTFDVQAGTDTKQWLHVGPVGDIGNALGSTATLTPVATTQYFWNGTLYRCRIAGAMTPAQIAAAMPLSTTLGTDVVIGGSTFRVCGTAARLAPNYNATAQNLRGVTVSNAGSGYVTSPVAVVLNTGAGTGANVTTLVVPALAGPGNSLVQKNATGLVTGTINIGSSTGIGVPTVGDGGMYNTAPSVFISPPSSLNSNLNYILLPGASGGSGCTVAPTSIAFTGGTFTPGTQTLTATIRGGRIVSLTYTGTSAYSSPPTGIAVTGGTFAVAPVMPNAAALAAVIPQVTATLDAAGAIVGFNVISAGSNFNSSPTVVLSSAVAGEVTAGTVTVRPSLYTLTASFFTAAAINGVTPATVNGAHNEATNMAGFVPSSRIISVLSSGGSQGITFTGNVILNSNTPLTLGGGPIDLGGNDMVWRSLTFAGSNSTAVSWIANGTIESYFNGTGARTFPFRAQGLTGAVQLNAGTGTGPAGGDNINVVRVTQLGAPSDGTLSMKGNRAFRVNIVSGAAFGTTPTMLLAWDPNDNIISDQASLLMAQSNTALTSGWTVRSVTSGTGALPGTGTRTSATTGVGPIVFASTMWFGWSSSFVAPAGLSYNVVRTTGHVYQSIAPVVNGGDGTGTLSTAAGDEGTQLIAWPGTPFQYQGSAVTGFTIHANGYVVLNNASYTYTSASSWDNTLASFNGGTGTPDINKRNVIAPFYDDHNKASPVIYHKIVGNVATIEWFNTTHFGLSGPQMYFQVILDGNDESITFNYGDMQLYNGTQNIRYSYTTGISGAFVSGTPQAGEIMQQQYENTTIFTNENSTRSGHGANGLAISPEPRSRIRFVPGVYVAAPAPGTTPPANDEPGAATLIPALAAFPSNIAWNNTFPVAPGSSNLFTTRYATSSPQPFCDASTGKRDVWFRFVASDPNTQVRIYPSGGFIARMEVKDQFLGDLAPSQCIVSPAQGGVITATLAGLTVGDDYYVRVYHDRTGTTAVATANVSSGSVTSINVTTPGTNYPIVAQSFGYNPANTGPIVRLTGGGGNGAVAGVNNPITTQILASLVGGNFQVSNVGNGYSTAPTVTIDSPDWGITGEFGIIVFAKPTNDDCFVAADNQAALLINVGNGNPVASQVLTGGATTNGSTTVTVTSTAALGTPGPSNQWVLVGPNLPPNVVATVVNATTLSLSAAATGTSTGLTFNARENTISGVTTGAATASAEAHGCTGTPDDDLWYRFVATSTRHTVFMTGTGGFDPAFSVFFGGACAGKLYLDPATGAAGSCAQATANLTGADGAEVLNLTTTIGQTYYIRAFHAGTGTAIGGTFSLSVYTPLPLQYQHAQSSAAYTPISGGTVLASGTIDNAVFKAGSATALRFNTFDYDSFYVSSNGWIQVGKVVPSTTTFYPLNVVGGFGAIAPLAADLEDAAGAAEIRYQFTGGEHVVQWSNMRRQDVAGESFSFQARMNATTGAITYHYGPGTYLTGPVIVVGMRTDQVANPTVTTAGAVPTTRPSEIFVLNRTTFGSPASQTFNQTTTGTTPTSAIALSATSFPAAGLRFQYTESTCTPYTASDALILSFDRSVANTIRWRRVPGSQGYELRWRYSTDPVSASNIVAVGAVDTDTSFTYAALSLNPSSYVIWDVATLCGALPTEKSHYSPAAVFSVIGDPIAYDYSHSVGTYTPITGTVVASGTTDDAMFVVNLAPLTVRINDQDFSDVSLSSNGFLVGGAVTLPTANYVPLAGLQGLGLVSPFGDDLQGNTGGQIEWADAGAEIVFEWQDWRRFAAVGESFNFQARYTKATHVWRFVYSGMGTISASDSFHVGIRASTNQTRRDIVALTGGPDWTKPVMGNSAVAATFVKKFPTSAANAPVDGRTITFTPITVGGVPRAFSPVTGGTPPGVITKTDVTDLKWIRAVNPGANNGALNGYNVRLRPTAAPETFASWATPFVVGASQTDTSMNLTGLEPGTEYLYQVAGRTTPNRTVFGGVGRFSTLPADDDLEFKSVPGPNASACFTNSVPVVIRVVNRGLNAVAIGQSIGYNVTVTPGTNHTGTFVTTAPIAPNDSLDITVGNDDFSTVTTYTISGSITWAPDEKASNNTLTPSANVTSYAIASAPVNYLMESAATGSSLSYISGTGNFTTNFGYTASMTNPTLSAQQGTNMLRFNAFSLTSGTTGRFATPCFNVPTNCFEMLFFHSRDNGFPAVASDEGTRLRVSTDGGITWSVPQTIRNVATNRDTGYVRRFFAPATTPTWQEFALDLGAYNGQNIKVAFDMLSRFGNNFAIDNIRVQGKAIVNDVAMEALVAPEPLSSCGTANVSVIVRVSNKGCVSHSNIPVTVNVTGAGVSTISDVIPGPLDGGQFVNFTVGTVNMVNAGTYVFNGNALVGGDQVPANSNLPTTNVALIAPPVVNITLSNANVVIGNNTTLNGTAAVASPSIAAANNTNVAIPDGPAGCGTPGTNANSTITLTAPGVPASAIERVTVNITHNFTDDVRLTLIAPNGSSIVLIDGCVVTGSNFTGTNFVASGAPSVLTGTGPLNGNWLPENPFSALTGSANGVWTLRVNDVFSIGTGTLLNWSIQIPNALNSASWTCPTCPTGFPVNFTTPPVVSVAYPNNPINYPVPNPYTVTLTATDRQGCVNSRDTTIFFFSENKWLGVNDGANNWNDPANWLASPKPPTVTQAVLIPDPTEYTFPPKINTGVSTGSLILEPGADVQIASGGTLNLAANLSSNFGNTTGAGALVFNGTTAQTTTGNHYATNVTVNKTAGAMTINGAMNISGTLTMANATSDITVGSGNLILTSNASGTGRIGVVPAGATITGEVTQQRWIPWPGPGVTGQWFFLGSPITNKDFRDFADNFTTYGPASAYGSQGSPIQVLGPQHSTILAYQESLSNDSTDEAQRDGWRAPSGLVTNGQGYRVWIERSSVNASNYFDNKGAVKTGVAAFPTLTRNVFGACSPAAYNCNLALTGWNLVANPYPSAIDWDAASGWTKPGNMQNAAYRYFGGGSGGFGMAGYGAYISGLGWSGASPAPSNPNVIPSSQGFFVRLTSGSSGVLSATEAVKVATPQGQFTRSNVVLSNVLKIALEKPIMQGDYGYNGVVRFMPEATDDLDPLYDYGNMGGSGFFFSFPVGGDQLMVNSLADLNEQKVVPMNTHFRGSNGAYLFNFSEMGSFPTGVEIYIKDKFANTLTDIVANPVYNFEVNASNSSIIDRFELIFNPSAVTGVKNLMGGAFFGVRPNPAAGNGKVTLAVSGVKDEVAQISIVDMVGKVVYVGKMNLKTEFLNEESVELGLPAGVYTVNFTSRSKSFKEKLIVR